QSAHRRADQDRRLRLRGRQAEHVVGELVHVITTCRIRAARHPVAFAMAARIVGHAAATRRGQCRRRAAPGAPVCPKPCANNRHGSPVGLRTCTAISRSATRNRSLVVGRASVTIRLSMDCLAGRRQPPAIHSRLQRGGAGTARITKDTAYGYHTQMNVGSKPERTRLSAEDWEVAALDLIAEQGVGALAVEALARQLGVTKGSFYWHFRTREALLNAALERWEQYGEREIIDEIAQITDPRK